MKLIRKSGLSLLLCAAMIFAMLSVTALADSINSLGFVFDTGTGTITGYTGYGGDITIPYALEGVPVTSIGDYAFSSCPSLIGLTIPSSVTSIGNSAFSNCPSLKGLKIPSSVTSIGDSAFSDDSNLIIQTVISSAVETYADTNHIPCISGVENYGSYYPGRTIRFNEGTATLDGVAYTSDTPVSAGGTHQLIVQFDATVSLTLNFTINSAVNEAPAIIGPTTMTLVEGYDAASTGAYTITGTAPVTVTKTFGDSKITWNDAKETLDIAAGLAAGSYPVTLNASNGTSPYATLKFTLTVSPAPVAPTITGSTAMTLLEGYNATSTGTYTITGTAPVTVTKTSGDSKITWNDTTKTLDIAAGLAVGEYPVTLKAGNGTSPDAILNLVLTVNVRPVFPFDASSGTITGYNGPGGDITIPSTIEGIAVTSIDHNAFANDTSITSVDIPAGVTSIGKQAFMNCSSLTSVHFSAAAQLKIIGDESFSFSGLTSVTLPDSVELVGDYAFYNCTNLKTASLSSGADSAGFESFLDCTALTTAIIPNGVINLNSTFDCCSALSDLTIPSSVQSIMNPFNGAGGVVIHTDAGSMAENFAKGNDIACISGVEDGGIYNTDRTIYFSKGTAPLTAFLDSAAYSSGTPVSAEGDHKLTVRFTSDDERTFYFTIDKTSPVAPTITGPAKLTLLKGYDAASTGGYTVTGTAPVTVTKTSGDSKITWNDAAKKMDIAPGLAPGIYPVTLIAGNGTSPDAELTFVLTVTDPADFIYDINTETITGYKGPGGDIVIPSTIQDPITGSDMTVISIGDEALSRHSITNVAFLPDCQIMSIRPFAFYNNYLTRIDIPDSVTRIYNHAFDINSQSHGDVLESANIPDSVKYIEQSAFGYNYFAVIHTTAGSAVQAFANDSKNSIPCVSGIEDGGVYNNGALTFDNLSSTISATLDGKPYESGTPVTDEGSHTFVLFEDGAPLRTYHFTIDKSAPTALSITGPKTVTLTQGYSAASSDAYAITGTAPVTVKKTSGDSKITWNDAAKKLDIAAGLGVGDYPVTLEVSDGTAAKTMQRIMVTVNEAYTNPSQYQFDSDTGTITGFTWNPHMNTSPNQGISIPSSIYDPSAEEYVPVLHINSLSGYAYGGEVTIPSTVTRIGDNAFKSTSIDRLNFPVGSQLKSIGNHALFSIGMLYNSTLEIPKGVVSIDDYAFANNFDLSSLSIPSSVVRIGDKVFDNDPNVIILTPAGSVAEAYAKSNKIPYISGVEEGGIYDDNRTIHFSEGTATLDGTAYTSGTPVGADGMHTLIVHFKQDVSLTLHFIIDKNSPVAPTITGQISLQLTKGYPACTSYRFFTSGSAPVTVTKTSGNEKITWNDASKRLDIGAGLDVGSYPVTLTASNGTLPDATFTFTLTVEPSSVAADVIGLTDLTLTEGYSAPYVDEFALTGTGPLYMDTFGNDHIYWSPYTEKLVILPGLAAGSYSSKFIVSNETGLQGNERTFTITVSPASAAHAITIETDGHGIAGSNEFSAAANTQIALTAIPYRGYIFKEWQIVSGGATLSNNLFTMPDEPVTVKAIFEKNPAANYTLTVNGSCASGFGSGSYAAGETAAIKAGSRSNYTFIGWSSADGVTFTDPTSASTTFTMPAKDVTVTAQWHYDGGDTGGGSGSPSAPAYTADVSVIDNSGNHTKAAAMPITVDPDKGAAVMNAGSQSNPISKGGTTVITVPAIPDVNTYTLDIPAPFLSTAVRQGDLRINTDKGNMTVPSNMLTGVAGADGRKAEISISRGDKSELPANVQAAIGDHPLIQFSMTIDGKQTEWNNPNAPVKVTIPYKPTAAELKSPESIIIWYIDGSGKAVSVPNGHYDAATGTVTFQTTHFSQYAVGYNNVSFADVSNGVWYADPVGYLAARDIVSGIGDRRFSPDATITRAQFVTILARMSGDETSYTSSAFTDVSTNDWYFAAAQWANKTGIAVGSDGKFDPNTGITREQMAVMLYRYAKYKGADVSGTGGTSTKKFSDSGNISDYATASIQWAVNNSIISGNGDGSFAPQRGATRAEAAKMLAAFLQSMVK